jgi:GT2 family glycosyltransferase
MKPNQNRAILDIAILTAGEVGLFEKCLDAVLAVMKPEYRIQVCNNGFPSQEYERVYKKLPENSTVKRLNVNIGYPGGANTAIRAGSAPLVLLVTDDVFLHNGSIEHLLLTMKDETIGLCGYKLIFPEDSVDNARPGGKVQHIGMASNIRGDMIHPLIGWSPTNPKCNVSQDVLAVTGASFIVRRSVYQKAGGFNPIYGKGYYEDMDLCFTIRSQGSRIYVNTNATATHGVGQTFKKDKTPTPIQQNQMIFRSKWITQLPWSEFTMW